MTMNFSKTTKTIVAATLFTVLTAFALGACDEGTTVVVPDTVVADTAKDIGGDAAPETSADVPTDSPLGDSGPDTAEVAQDTASEVAQDVASEVAQDVATDITPDVPSEVAQPGPVVISYVPTDKSSVEDTTPDIIVTFDKSWILSKLDPSNVTMVEVDAGAGVSLAITVDYQKNNSGAIDPKTLQIKSPTLSAGKTYRCTVTNVKDAQDTPMEGTLEWTFSVVGCGDGICTANEDQCGCSVDCGGCAGCCEYNGPGYTCQPGTAKNKCGSNGQSCGVCEGADQCINGQGCG